LHLRVAPANALVTDKAPGRVRTDLGARTSAGGGSKSNGTVFELSPLSGGGWSETVIHDFMGWPSDGIQTTGVRSTKSRGAIEVHKPRGPKTGDALLSRVDKGKRRGEEMLEQNFITTRGQDQGESYLATPELSEAASLPRRTVTEAAGKLYWAFSPPVSCDVAGGPSGSA
jgi:hypothetical protein